MHSHIAFQAFSGTHIHLGVTGSIAAYKTLDLLRALKALNLQIGVTLTGAAARFVTPLAFSALGAQPVYSGAFDPEHTPFAHLEPGQQATALVVAPASANFLAKAAHGLADDLLSTQYLAFDGPVVIAPAMNPRMWSHPATRANWRTLLERGVCGLEPDCGGTACGETGQGRLTRLEEIYCAILRAIAPQDLSGRRLLMTLGPTREFWDAVRMFSNPSTGTMGAALAVSAWMRGAEVTVVRGPCDPFLPAGIRVIDVVSAREMYAETVARWPEADMACLCAAVSDFSPTPHGPEKFKRHGQDVPALEMTANPDILLELGRARKPGQTLIGFAAETSDLDRHAKDKLVRKNLDLIVANRIGQPDSGFASSTNACYVLDRQGRSEEWPILPKTEIAWRIWDWLSLI